MQELTLLLNQQYPQWRDHISPDPLEAALYLGLIDDSYLENLDVPELNFNDNGIVDYD